MGLSRKIWRDPWDISSDWRSDRSIIGPRISVKHDGRQGEIQLSQEVADHPNRVMIITSKMLLLTL